MRNVAISKMDLIDLIFLDEISQFRFGIDGNSFRIKFPGQSCRIFSAFNIRDLGSSKSYYLVIWVITKIDIEIVKSRPAAPIITTFLISKLLMIIFFN